MNLLIDTSICIEILRDDSSSATRFIQSNFDDTDLSLTRFSQFELLQGVKSEQDWQILNEYLGAQDYLDVTPQTWSMAARIYFDLRRRGETVRSNIDCCIAQIAIENQALLLHRDRDFEKIALVRPLQELRI